MSISTNIEARKAAEECFDLLSDFIREAEMPPEAAAKAWRRLGDMVDEVTGVDRKPPEPPSAVAMDDVEAKRFESQVMPFGKYGPDGEDGPKRVCDVPISYLTWIDEQPNFRKDLTRYLRRRDIWEQQNGTD